MTAWQQVYITWHNTPGINIKPFFSWQISNTLLFRAYSFLVNTSIQFTIAKLIKYTVKAQGNACSKEGIMAAE